MVKPESNAYTGQHRGDRNAYRRYLAGMDASMRQKVALTAAHLLSESTVADMGMGSGSGSHTLAALYPDFTKGPVTGPFAFVSRSSDPRSID